MTLDQPADEDTSKLSKYWRKLVIKPVKNQLTRGTSPKKVALTMAISPVISAFPIMGTTNVLSVIAGSALRLNIPFLMLFKSLFYPLHLGLILVFIRIGESLNGAPHIPFSIPQLLGKFKDDPMQFTKDFGMTALYGIEAWAIIAPWFAIPLYFIFHHLIMQYMKKRITRSTTT
ncbi:MAG: DUF2062 domain-containing protein [Akkermansiaceae bacterium]